MSFLIKALRVIALPMCLCIGLVGTASAQYLDVASGYQTLNVAVEGDTIPGGAPLDSNRVYRLERGGTYLLNGSVEGLSGIPLRIVAADGEGPLPMIIPATDETGASARAFKPNDDGFFKNLYISSLDDLGKNSEDTKNTIRGQKKGGRYVVEGCFLDYNYQNFARMNAAD